MPWAEHDPTVWRPAHALDARRAAQHGAGRTATDIAAQASDEPPYRRIACPSCGHVTDDESLLDVRTLTPAQREAFGIHPGADFACTSVCLNDARNAGASLEALYRALGAPAAACAVAREVDAAHPARHALRPGQQPRIPVRRPTHRPGPLPLD